MKRQSFRFCLTCAAIFMMMLISACMVQAEEKKTTVYKGVNYARVYDYDYYVKRYPNVRINYKTPEKILEYFVTSGIPRRQRASQNFDPVSYYNGNLDLRLRFGHNWYKYYKHYINVGYRLEKYKNTATGCKTPWRKYKAAYQQAMRCKADLKRSFDWIVKFKYYGHNTWQKEHPDESIGYYADFGFKHQKGNCYVMAACMYEMAYELGYEVKYMTGYVRVGHSTYFASKYIDGMWWNPHAWTEVKDKDGKWHICDPNFTNETRRNGYMVNYKQPGTWRYTYYEEKKEEA